MSSTSLARLLAVFVAFLFYGLLALLAFDGPQMLTPIFGSVPLSILLGMAFIFLAVGSTWLYAWRAGAAEGRS
jgi:uncharacterized membrane protein (DUF485 family)